MNTVKVPDRGGSIKLEEKNNHFTTNTTTINNTEILDQTSEIQNNLKEIEDKNNTDNVYPPSSDAFTSFTYSPSVDNAPVEEVKGFRLSLKGPIHYKKPEKSEFSKK